ncbi:hypothetical protein SLEP1_g44803 [Rubroshorea leprosula]|uniref:Uncharacterized protein n=1 Tax=Rubroshorea leprosula TaxID=152421 RepID=A0AAV5LHQ4_9ROSI|nr:hypothetical protein SLEP1_g44803 [Rubroshorea leprosula]
MIHSEGSVVHRVSKAFVSVLALPWLEMSQPMQHASWRMK